jgi:elongation factor Ts
MDISTEQIKELRDKTGVSIMQCRKALEESKGDMEKALLIIKKKSGEMAAKKADRTFSAGTIASYVHSNGRVGSMVELVSETDFVSGNPEFKALAYDIAMHAAATMPMYLRKEDVNADEVAKLNVFFAEEAKDKPENIRAKIIEGKLASFLAERTLLEQPFIKNPEHTIQGLIDAAMLKFGEKIEVARFVRFGVLEK